MLGELIPMGGGDPIPLLRDKLRVGRRENCDIVLRFGNVSAYHCDFSLKQGYWFIEDLGSRNGTKVNGKRVKRKRVDPGDTVAFAKHQYQIRYQPSDLGAAGPPPPDEDDLGDILSHSLLDRAGLERRSREDDR